MDESAYQQTRAAWSQQVCVFEKTILTKCVYCAQAEQHNLAEREVVLCKKTDYRDRCRTLYSLLRTNFSFALGKVNNAEQLTYAQEMRLQCGGLKGLQCVMNGSDDVDDVVKLLDGAQQQFVTLEELPFQQIVQAAKEHYQYRKQTPHEDLR